MAWGNFLLDKGQLGNASAITKYRAVKHTAAETVGPVTANTDDIFGFAQFDASVADQARGKDVTCRVLGVTEAEAVGAIGIDKWCTLEADGRVSQLVGASGKKIVGKCVGSPSTNAGDRIAMLIVHTNAVA